MAQQATTGTQTTIFILISGSDSKPVEDARVTLIVNGQSPNRSSRSEKTQENGLAAWAFPTDSIRPDRDGKYSCHYSVKIGSANYNGHARATAGTINTVQFAAIEKNRILKERMDAAEKRWKNTVSYPMSDRTKRELLDDISYQADTVNKFLKGAKVLIPFAKAATTKYRKELVLSIKGLENHKKFYNDLRFYQKDLKNIKRTYKVVNKLSAYITVVTAGYEIFEGIHREDYKKVFSGLGNGVLNLLALTNPLSAAAVLGLQIGFGLGKVLALGAKGDADPNVVEGVVRQRNLPSLNKVGSCPAFSGSGKQCRLKREGRSGPWSSVSYDTKVLIMPGFAFDDKGRLVLVTSDGLMILCGAPSEAELNDRYDAFVSAKANL